MTNVFSSHTTRTFQRGFSLLELSIALAVIGIVVAGGLTMSTSMVDRQAYVQTGNQMEEVDKALAAFVAVNDRLPCPSNPALALGHADFGKEMASCAGTQSAVGTGGKNVRIGGLPVRSLGLRDRMAADEYGNRYTYAVTTNLTSDAETGGYRDAAEAGAISMAGTTIDDAAYAVVSHGGDSKGAYRYETANNNVTCSGTAQDVENCNGDATFRDTRFNRGSVTNNWFDDSIRFSRKEMINLTAGGASAGGSQFWAADGNHIYNTNSGNVGIGGAAGIARLSVYSSDTQNVLSLEGRNGSTNTLDISSAMGENGILLLTNGTERAIRIDHVGENGTGIDLTMNNDNTVGLNLHLLSSLSTGLQIQGPDTTNSTGVLVDNVNTGIDVSNVVFGLKANVTSGLGSAVFGSSTENNLILFRGDLSGNNATGLGITASGANNTGVNVSLSASSGRAIQGTATATGAGTTYGGYFTSASSTGVGVYGAATNTTTGTGSPYGVYGVTNNRGTNSAGVRGEATYNNISFSHGVEGVSVATAGAASGVMGRGKDHGLTGYGGRIGVYGAVMPTDFLTVSSTTSIPSGVVGGLFRAAATANTDYGVYAWGAEYGVHATNDSATGLAAGHFTNQSTIGKGVVGRSTTGTGSTIAGDFTNASNAGLAVYGYSSATTGNTRGVVGEVESASAGASGVVGQASGGGTNATYGVWGSSNSPNGYGVYCAGARCGGTVAWTPASDARLKEHVTSLDDGLGLDAIRKLRPVTYDWKDTGKKQLGKQIGFIAQEVEKVFPELVVSGADYDLTLANGKKETVKNTKAMAYETLTAPLVRAVQQLADKLDALFDSVKKLFDRVDAQDAKITALEAENKALKDRLDALEAKITN